jgi:hypothetical protein
MKIDFYGFVKRLANLQAYFWATSGWHIAQSALILFIYFTNQYRPERILLPGLGNVLQF